MLRLHGLKLCLLCSQLHLLCFFLLPHQLKHLIHQRNKGKEKKEKTLAILLFNETKKKRRTWSRHATFLACGELLIFRNALAPRSRASGSNPAAVVRGLSLRTRATSAGGTSAAGGPGAADVCAGGASREV